MRWTWVVSVAMCVLPSATRALVLDVRVPWSSYPSTRSRLAREIEAIARDPDAPTVALAEHVDPAEPPPPLVIRLAARRPRAPRVSATGVLVPLNAVVTFGIGLIPATNKQRALIALAGVAGWAVAYRILTVIFTNEGPAAGGVNPPALDRHGREIVPNG